MTTQLNIKDAETVRLARELARRNGTSVTMTIRVALEQANAKQREAVEARAAGILAKLRGISLDLPSDLKGKSARQIVDELHEQDWQDQYGRDEWS